VTRSSVAQSGVPENKSGYISETRKIEENLWSFKRLTQLNSSLLIEVLR